MCMLIYQGQRKWSKSKVININRHGAQIKSPHFFGIPPILRLVTLDHQIGIDIHFSFTYGIHFCYKFIPKCVDQTSSLTWLMAFSTILCVLIFHIFKRSTRHKIWNGRMSTTTPPDIHCPEPSIKQCIEKGVNKSAHISIQTLKCTVFTRLVS